MTFKAQIGHVYSSLIKFTLVVWLLTTDGKIWMKRIWLNTAEVPMLMRQMFFIQWDKKNILKKEGTY